MFKLKSRFLSALPPLDKTARLPLLLCALLAAAVAIQLTDAGDVELPPPGPVGRGGSSRSSNATPERAVGGQAIVARSVFAPSASAASGGASQIGDRKIVGSIRIGRATYAVVQGGDGRTTSIAVGGRIGDWRLRAVREGAVLLERGEERIIVPFGAGAPLPANAAANGSQR
jgi:hypothetical protein